MATSALPGAITALLTIFGAASGLDGVKVIDGPPTDDIATEDFLAVGWTGADDQPAADTVQDFAAAGARTRDEDFTIACVIDAWSGDDSFSVVRARVFAILGIVEQELRASGPNPPSS